MGVVLVGLPKLGVEARVAVVVSGVMRCDCMVAYGMVLAGFMVGSGSVRLKVGKSCGGVIVGIGGCGGGICCECWRSVSRLLDNVCINSSGRGRGCVAQ